MNTFCGQFVSFHLGLNQNIFDILHPVINQDTFLVSACLSVESKYKGNENHSYPIYDIGLQF
jgi:hypothetical protein